MFDQLFSYLRWTLPNALTVAVFVMIFWRKLPRQLPCFTVYLGINLAQGLSYAVLARKFGYRSIFTYYYFYSTQGIVLLARGLAIAELCYRFLRAYRGIWGMTWRLLAFLSVGLTLYAALGAVGETRWIGGFVATLGRGLELAAAVTLLGLLGITAYYRISVARLERFLAYGFIVYSVSLILYYSASYIWYQKAEGFSLIQEVSYVGVLVLWLVALRMPVVVEVRPQLLHREVYAQVIPQVNAGLQRLNDRLVEILRT